MSVSRRRVLGAASILGAAAVVGSCGNRTPGDRVDVIVVGAGTAGLSAARSLTRAGANVVILEARDRVGGRIMTSELWPAAPVDLGASWIHGADGNPVYDEAVALGIDTAVFDVGSADGQGSFVLYSPNGTRLDADSAEQRLDAVLERLERLPAPPEVSLAAGVDELPAPMRAAARESGLTEFAADYGATPDQLALSALAEDDSFSGPQRVFPGGFGQLTTRIAEGLDVRYGTAVQAISLRDDSVALEAGGQRWVADAVIVTVPLGVLKAGTIRFDPPLPDDHQRAIDAIGFGRYEKLILQFDEPFWDDVDQISVARSGAFTNWYNLERVTGQPVLMALNGGAAAAELESLPVARQTTLAAETLSGIYGGRFRGPMAAQASDWWSDPFSRGSYSFTAVGSSADHRVVLGESVGGRLWLAGEATHPTLHSTVHGAWLSGENAAEQVAR